MDVPSELVRFAGANPNRQHSTRTMTLPHVRPLARKASMLLQASESEELDRGLSGSASSGSASLSLAAEEQSSPLASSASREPPFRSDGAQNSAVPPMWGNGATTASLGKNFPANLREPQIL